MSLVLWTFCHSDSHLWGIGTSTARQWNINVWPHKCSNDWICRRRIWDLVERFPAHGQRLTYLFLLQKSIHYKSMRSVAKWTGCVALIFYDALVFPWRICWLMLHFFIQEGRKREVKPGPQRCRRTIFEDKLSKLPLDWATENVSVQ